MEVTTETNATPLARIFATRFRHALQHKSYEQLVKKSTGKFTIKARRNPQAITITISSNCIHIDSGIKPGCDLVLHINLDQPDDNPKVKGILRHPLYAIAVSKLLDFPTTNWADALKRFWDQHSTYPGMPSGITARSLDEDRQLSVGDTQDSAYFEGLCVDLSEAFSGSTPLIQLAFAGKITGRYSMQHAAVISDVTLQMMLGDI